MFEHLDDPSPRAPGDDTRAAVIKRAHDLVVHRRIAMLSGLVAALVLVIGLPAVILGSGGGSSRQKLQAAAAPPTTAGGQPGVLLPTPGQPVTGQVLPATNPGPKPPPPTTAPPPVAGHIDKPVPVPPKVPLHLADAIVFNGDASSYAGGPAGQPGIYVMNADGSAESRLTSDNDGYPSWSPDHSRIVFVRGSELWVMKPDGTGLSQLTSGASDGYPAWSRDGTRIAFSSNRQGGGIFAMNADGTGIVKVIGDGFDPSWSPDGKKLAFTRDDNNNAEVYVVNADGTGAVNLTNNPGWDAAPAWSPDGKKIAFESGRHSSQDTDIYVMGADGSNPIQLAPDPAFDHDPAWSPDGSKIAFDSFRQPCGLPNNGCLQHIWTMNADGSGARLLTQDPISQYTPDW